MAPGPDGPSRIDDTTAGNTPPPGGAYPPTAPRPGRIRSQTRSFDTRRRPCSVSHWAYSLVELVETNRADHPAHRWSSPSRPHRCSVVSLSRPRRSSVVEPHRDHTDHPVVVPVETTPPIRWSSPSRPRRRSVVEPVETTPPIRWSSPSRPHRPSGGRAVETTSLVGGRAHRDHTDHPVAVPVETTAHPVVELVETTAPIGGRARRDHTAHPVVEPVETTSLVGGRAHRDHTDHPVVELVETTAPIGGRARRDHGAHPVVEPVETTPLGLERQEPGRGRAGGGPVLGRKVLEKVSRTPAENPVFGA